MWCVARFARHRSGGFLSFEFRLRFFFVSCHRSCISLGRLLWTSIYRIVHTYWYSPSNISPSKLNSFFIFRANIRCKATECVLRYVRQTMVMKWIFTLLAGWNRNDLNFMWAFDSIEVQSWLEGGRSRWVSSWWNRQLKMVSYVYLQRFSNSPLPMVPID